MRAVSIAMVLLAACGGTQDGAPDSGSGTPDTGGTPDTVVGTYSVVGVWQTPFGDVTLTTTFSGSATSGTAKLSQQTPVSGDTATCKSDLLSEGAYTVTGDSITITVTSAHQVTRGCSFPDSDEPSDLAPAQSYAGALSGPFVLTATTLKLGSTYPTFDRVVR